MSDTQIGLSAAASYEMLQSESRNSLVKFSKPMARAFGLHMLLDEVVESHNIAERSGAAFDAAERNFYAPSPRRVNLYTLGAPEWSSDAVVVAAYNKMLSDAHQRNKDLVTLEMGIKAVLDSLSSQMSAQEVFDQAESKVGA